MLCRAGINPGWPLVCVVHFLPIPSSPIAPPRPRHVHAVCGWSVQLAACKLDAKADPLEDMQSKGKVMRFRDVLRPDQPNTQVRFLQHNGHQHNIQPLATAHTHNALCIETAVLSALLGAPSPKGVLFWWQVQPGLEHLASYVPVRAI
jgi:hypothetical protein